MNNKSPILRETLAFSSSIFTFDNTDLNPEVVTKTCLNISSSTSVGRKSYSNSGGYQSDLIWNDSKLSPADSLVIAAVQRWGLDIAHEIAKLHDTKVKACSGLWININGCGDYNITHNHPGAKFSLVYYAACPESSGRLIFERHDAAVYCFADVAAPKSDRSYLSYAVAPYPGLVVGFPAYLPHRVEANKSNDLRVSIAMNFS